MSTVELSRPPSGHGAPEVTRGSGEFRRRLRWAAVRYGPVLLTYGVLKLAGFAVFMYLLDSAGDFRKKNPRFGGGEHPWDVLASWDGWWYQQIAEHGYDPALEPVPGATGLITLEGNSAAFFPLYPALMRLVSECTGLGLFGAGLTVSVLASFVAALGIYAVTRRLGGHRAGLVAAGLWAVWPGSGTEWSGYSESLYTALAVWACHAVMSRRWLTAGLLTFAAGLCRPTAAALVAALAVAALLSLRRRADGVLRPLAAVAIAPLGLFGYLAWVNYRMGDINGYSKLQDGAWAHKFDWGAHTFKVLTSLPVGHFDYLFARAFEDVIGVCVVLAVPALTVLLLRLRPPAVLVVYTVLSYLMVMTTQQIFGNVSRYLLPLFPLFVPLALAMSRLGWPSLVTVLGTAALASGSYAGYVLFELGVP
ncbi:MULTISPECIES: glycosyltransferase family 39 protein [Streptomyces]|uniref:glycosyltransferase family 39 protein n=1 Tax=Streptomyces TaxID=1883 RepID=UPI002035AAA3|nr:MULTISPECIES: glycosyltransferase family 39 protein [Streptomyces]UUA10894.1 glycosyltransferase family 39 protein [Streptomyces koelreuteriae]UUA18500.1 glycosyltransferase family 39 protein [Streptomyces sp. CRCS-T-1]